jgi:hypothetical protein
MEGNDGIRGVISSQVCFLSSSRCIHPGSGSILVGGTLTRLTLRCVSLLAVLDDCFRETFHLPTR